MNGHAVGQRLLSFLPADTYLYGAGRIAQQSAAGKEYFLGDALGSVRQLADATGAVRLARSYQPYGKLLASDGSGATGYGFNGEWTDTTGKDSKFVVPLMA